MQHPYRQSIAPIPAGSPRPLWSVMIPTFNCAQFLPETLASVLAQDPGPELMQIEVIDDSSTEDDPAAVVSDVGHGRVLFYRQPLNVGHTRNFDTCLQRSRGQLIHLLHGDDYVRMGFYRKMQRAFEDHPEIGAGFCRFISMDEHGHWQAIWPVEQLQSDVLHNWLERIAIGQRLQPPSMVVRRQVYEQLGGFDRRIICYGEDWEMWVRIAAQYAVWYEVEPLAVYRVGSTSLSGHALRSGENVRDLRRVIEIIQDYLPTVKGRELATKAREECALAAIRRAFRLLGRGDMQAPLVQMREALKCSHSVNVIGRSLFLLGCWSALALGVQPPYRSRFDVRQNRAHQGNVIGRITPTF